MLAKTAQIFHKEPHEIALRAAGGKFEMISPGDNRIQSVLNSHQELQKIGQFFQISIHFHLANLQTKIIDSSFCSLEGLFLTKLNHYFNVPIRY